MKFAIAKTGIAISLSGLMTLMVSPANAAVMADAFDGMITAGEYQWDTTTPPNSKWYTRDGDRELNDGSGGPNWDINFLGFGIHDDKVHIGAIGGSILEGSNKYSNETLELSDIAINVVTAGDSTDPTESSSGWDYALRLMDVDDDGNASFSLFGGGSWWGSGKEADSSDYLHENYAYGSTDTFRMKGDPLDTPQITGKYTAPDEGGNNGVLEVSFDLGLLSLFNEQTGGRIITYLTMSCVNDEAIVDAQVSPVPLPSAVWLFGSALIGFIGMSRRTRV